MRFSIYIYISNAGTMDGVEVEQMKNRIKESILTNIIPDTISGSALEVLNQVLRTWLPAMQSEIVVSILPKVQEHFMSMVLPPILNKIEVTMTDHMVTLKKEMKEEEHRHRYTKRDAEKYIERNCEKFRAWKHSFKETFQKATRCEELVKLWDECLNSTPSYVPRKFRKDKYHIKSALELDILKIRERNDLTSEMEILKLRELENRRRIEDLDNEVFNFLTKEMEDPYVKAEIMKFWEATKKEKTDSCKQMWAKKIEGMKKTYQKDTAV